ncbi:hypothetical protein [Bacillus thuringiensis]|uniref:hypothetical protein n=1 Tax=Bacillus thuringiensis TaxID=1428 RepID=UPI0005CEF02E|nr:hypothetical protein [Bacillus thuringiensis]
MLYTLYSKVKFSNEELNIIHNYMANSIHSTVRHPINLESLSTIQLISLEKKMKLFLELLPNIYIDMKNEAAKNNNNTFVMIDDCFVVAFTYTHQQIKEDIQKRFELTHNRAAQC